MTELSTQDAQLLARLPAKQEAVFRALRGYETRQKTHAQIAKKMNITIAEVKNLAWQSIVNLNRLHRYGTLQNPRWSEAKFRGCK